MTNNVGTMRHGTSEERLTDNAQSTIDRARAGGLGRGLTSLIEEGETPDFGGLFQGEKDRAVIRPRR